MLKAVILDDEPRGSKLLQQKLMDLDGKIDVVSVFNDPLEALAAVARLSFDVLFLDVEMPIVNGFQFLEKLGSFGFEVIFVTAFDSYALKALRINALDYLLKPVDTEELRCAVDRLAEKVVQKSAPHAALQDPVPLYKRIALPTAEGVHLIRHREIVKIEALGNYSTFHLKHGQKIVVSKTLGDFESILNQPYFYRVNRSVILNLEYVAKYRRGEGGTLELLDGSEIEVSSSRKELLLKRLFL